VGVSQYISVYKDQLTPHLHTQSLHINTCLSQ